MCKDKRGVMPYTACEIVWNARTQGRGAFKRCIKSLGAGSKKGWLTTQGDELDPVRFSGAEITIFWGLGKP